VQKGFFSLKSNKDAVLASCRFSGRAPIGIFQCKILDFAYISRGIVCGHPEYLFFPHSIAWELANERSNSLDH